MTHNDTITEAQLIERLKAAGLYSEKRMKEVVKTAADLEPNDMFLVAAPGTDDAVLFTVKRVIVGKYDLKPGTRAIVGSYGQGGEVLRGSFVANDYDEFTILVD